LRPEGPVVNSPGRKAGVGKEREMSAEGAALSRFKYRAWAIYKFIRYRAFGTHSFLHPNPGLTAGPSHCRSFGPDRQF